MCRNTRRHSDRDSLCTIHQKIRNTNRKHLRLFFCLVKVRSKVHNSFIQVRKEYLLCQFCKTSLRVTHRSSAVSLDRAKVSMSVHKNHSFFEFLRHYDQRFVDGTVSMRVVFTHRIPDDTRTFSIWFIIADT